jgi:hypothetical protein
VLFPTQQSEKLLVHKITLFASTPTLITFFVKTSRLLALVQTVFLKECVVLSERTLVLLLV